MEKNCLVNEFEYIIDDVSSETLCFYVINDFHFLEKLDHKKLAPV